MSRDRGEHYERLTERLLRRAGLRILARNYRRRCGELDLVALESETLVFVEVRARSPGRFGSALASVDGRKQRRLLATAQCFLQEYPQHRDRACRFDVVAWIAQQSPACAEPVPQWLRAAFTA